MDGHVVELLQGARHAARQHPILHQQVAQLQEQLQLLRVPQPHRAAQHLTHPHGLLLDHVVPVVDVGVHGHQHLAVKAVSDASVAGDGVAKVLHLEGALETTGKEATKWCDDGGEDGEHHGVQLHRHGGEAHVADLLRQVPRQCRLHQAQHLLQRPRQLLRRLHQAPAALAEDGVSGAVQAAQRQVPPGACQPLELRHELGCEEGEGDCEDESADEALPGLLGGQLDEGRAAKEEACQVRGDVVDDDEQ
mmetsp:Transcript_6268/g.13755  ORF Transcript_6268/g.13755 Transcript_6268/m.13755 type:complete len:249 (+) Transcript_6268:625-1371(+)